MIRWEPLGDRAFLATFATEAEAAGWASAVQGRRLDGVIDVVAAFRSVAVFADPDRVSLEGLEVALRGIEAGLARRQPGALITIPVLYDGEDLPEVAQRLGLTVPEVVAHHHGEVYTVFAIGFLPGFPYAGDLPEPLRGLPRRGVPRRSVPAGAVAIAGRQTGIYPRASPGGWHLIGRTPVAVVDLERGLFPIRVGDRLRFVPIEPDEFDARAGLIGPQRDPLAGDGH